MNTTQKQTANKRADKYLLDPPFLWGEDEPWIAKKSYMDGFMESKEYWQTGMYDREQYLEAIEAGVNEGKRSQLQTGMYDKSEVIAIIETLMQYGNIRPIEGIRYSAGTHKEMLDKANLWLWNNRDQNKKKP